MPHTNVELVIRKFEIFLHKYYYIYVYNVGIYREYQKYHHPYKCQLFIMSTHTYDQNSRYSPWVGPHTMVPLKRKPKFPLHCVTASVSSRSRSYPTHLSSLHIILTDLPLSRSFQPRLPPSTTPTPTPLFPLWTHGQWPWVGKDSCHCFSIA